MPGPDFPFSNGIQFPIEPVVPRPGNDPFTLWHYRESRAPAETVATLGADGGATASTYVSQTLRWVKIGEEIFYTIRIILSAKGTFTGNVRIEGLPYPASFQSAATVGFWLVAVNKISVNAYVAAGETNIYLYGLAAAAANPANLVNADIANNSQFFVSGHYRVN